MRHAMSLYPQATYFFYLDPHSLIMSTGLSIKDYIMDNSRLEKLMIPNVPIVPPDSVIKSNEGLSGDNAQFVLTQDKEGLSEKSFIMKQGEWAKYMLDAWYDPLYRQYNFQKAERHALEHMIQ
jgi:mannan polymerase II complex MNN11 subunit